MTTSLNIKCILLIKYYDSCFGCYVCFMHKGIQIKNNLFLYAI